MGARIFLLLLLAGLVGACAFQDPELDQEISAYRGKGIQRDGDRMPRRSPEDVDN